MTIDRSDGKWSGLVAVLKSGTTPPERWVRGRRGGGVPAGHRPYAAVRAWPAALPPPHGRHRRRCEQRGEAWAAPCVELLFAVVGQGDRRHAAMVLSNAQARSATPGEGSSCEKASPAGEQWWSEWPGLAACWPSSSPRLVVQSGGHGRASPRPGLARACRHFGGVPRGRQPGLPETPSRPVRFDPLSEAPRPL